MADGFESVDIREDVMFRLRTATAASHGRLETSLDLLTQPMLKSKFQRLLAGFEAFHEAWEPAVARHPQLASLMSERSRLRHLRRDLAAMSLPGEPPRKVATFQLAGDIATSLPGALGSLYVMEGSTMGGQLIARALRACDWAPAGGLTYFTPYGANAGTMWRAFQDRLRTYARNSVEGELEKAATETFDLLRTHLTA